MSDETQKNRKWLIIGGIVVVLIIIGALSRGEKPKTDSEATPLNSEQAVTNESTSDPDPTEAVSEEAVEEPTSEPAMPPTEKEVRSAIGLSSAFIDQISLDDTKLSVELKGNASYPDYYSSGDKRNKLLAIEPIRWMVKLPGLEKVRLTIKADGRTSRVVMSRREVEDFVGSSLNSFSDGAGSINDTWRTDFLTKYDNKESREQIVQQFQQ